MYQLALSASFEYLDVMVLWPLQIFYSFSTSESGVHRSQILMYEVPEWKGLSSHNGQGGVKCNVTIVGNMALTKGNITLSKGSMVLQHVRNG